MPASSRSSDLEKPLVPPTATMPAGETRTTA
jgi:hypothetical protein